MVRLAIISFILFVPFNLISQVETKLDTLNYIRDTLHKNDTVPLYKNIKNLAANSKIANLIYQALFKEPGQNTPSPIICTDKYSYYQGRKIGKIKIVVLDPFGNIRGDSVAVPISVLEIIGNKTHMTTRNWVIKDLLLFKTGESLDSLKLIESERLIRLAGGNRDARINIICPFDDDNKIDILVVVRDQFSITGGVGIGGDTQDFSIEDNNFLGLSNQLSTKIGFHAKEPKGTSFDGHYLVSNISNSYISGIVTYSSSSFHRRAGISFDRAFVTPLIKWAGGVNLSFMKTYWPFDSSGTTATEPLNFMMLDNWIARSFSLRAKNINEYSEPKLILGARYSRLEYEEKPSYEFDFNKINQNTSLYLASIAYSERGYYKDINIFRFDRIEDVPKGKLATLTLGYESKELSRRPYIGLKLASGDHISKFGYLAGKMEFGALINKGSSEQGVFNTTVNYLTDLWKYKNWNMRQFISYRLMCGINRRIDEKINLSGDNGLVGFNSDSLWGTNRAVLNFSTVIYLPYKLIGFQFAPIIFASFGTLGNTPLSTIQNHIYQSYGLGLLIRNEYLVFNTIQFTFSYFPSVPGRSGGSEKLNPLTVSVLRFIDYAEGKPEYVRFQ